MRHLKKPLRKLLHSHGNLHDKVVKLWHELNEVQKALDKESSSMILRDEETAYLNAFTQATLDEEYAEIHSVMFSIGNDKALGLDGYTSIFFKKA
ncbi:hypothetical protein Tco_0300070 [Tanacetum coccineum]